MNIGEKVHEETVRARAAVHRIFVPPSEKVMKRTLGMLLAGTKGGPSRLQILLLLEKSHMNINKMAKTTGMDYKTVQYHVRVLEKANLVRSYMRSYDNEYRLAELMLAYKRLLAEIAGKSNLGKSK